MRREEKALRESEELLLLFMRHSPIYAYIKTVTPTESRFLQVSDNYRQMLGLSDSDVAGKSMTELFPAELAEKIAAEDRAVIASGAVLELEEELNGRCYSTIKFPIAQGERILLAGYTIDITERKRIETGLVESEDRYHRITAAVMDYFFTVYVEEGRAARTVHGSACIGVTGYSAEEFAADPYLWYDMIHPEDRELAARQAADILGGAEPYPILHRILRKDGAQRWIANTPVPHRDPGGRLLSYDGIIRDITERKLAEDRIKDLLAEKELLLREVHHRIKNNMNTMMGLLSMQADLAPDRSASLALQDAKGRLQSMGVLYDKLYRSENMRELSLVEYLPALVTEVVGLFPNNGNVRVETAIADFPLGVKVLSCLGIMVNELVTNVMKYAFKGREAGLIRVSASIEGHRVAVAVEDDGVGLPEGLDFEHSSGFGLQLVGMLARQLDGVARIERGGAGARFVLEFEAEG